MVGPILRQLEGGASVDGLADYLVREFHAHFGTGPTRDEAAAWARAAQKWFTSHWPESEAAPRPDG